MWPHKFKIRQDARRAGDHRQVHGLVAFGCMVALLLSGLLTPVHSADVEGLYTAEVPVTGRGDAARAAGVRAALAVVLVKVSGAASIVAHPAVVKALKGADRYVQQFRFTKASAAVGLTPALAPPETPLPSTAEGTLNLWVAFDGKAVVALMRDNGLPIWDATRPLVLVWLVVDEGGDRRLVELEAHPEWRSVLATTAQQRGLPLVFPALDIEDHAAITADNVWRNEVESMQLASARYRPDAVLVGQLTHSSTGAWQGQWTLYQFPHQIKQWTVTDPALPGLLRSGVIETTESLAAKFAQVFLATPDESVTLVASEVNSYERYAKLMRYLKALDQVASVTVERLDKSELLLRIVLRGSRESFAKVVMLGDLLQTPPVAPDNATLESSAGSVSAPSHRWGADFAYRLSP